MERTFIIQLDQLIMFLISLDKSTSTWSAKTWTGLTNFYGQYIWTDGTDIYCTNGSGNVPTQYVLDKTTSTWTVVDLGLSNFNIGSFANGRIWYVDNTPYYFSYYSYASSSTTYYADNSLKFNKNEKKWNWNTLYLNDSAAYANIYGPYIWTDGDNIYYSDGSTNQCVLDKATSTWNLKLWTTTIYGYNVWTDGENTYYSNGSTQYVLDKTTSTWETKTWNGLTSFDGQYIWTDGTDIYYSNGSTQYVLDKTTSTWETKTWNGLTSFDGRYIWSDGTDIYYSTTSNSSIYYYFYIYKLSNDTWVRVRSHSSTSNANYYLWTAQYMWTDGINIYCDGTVNYKAIWSDGETMYHNKDILVLPDPDD